MYEYAVEILRVVDGDTVDCRIALGFGLTSTLRFRVAGVDTPEVYGRLAQASGDAAREFTARWLAERYGRLRVRTFKGAQNTVGIGDGAFGRWAAAFLDHVDNDLASALRAAGHTA